MKIASYNIRKALGTDRRRDPARVLSVLNGIGADVVLLQEADLRLGPRPTALPRFLISQETDYKVADVAINDVSLGWHGNAVLVRKGLACPRTERLPLPGLEPRGAVLVEVDGLTFVGAHLGLMRRYRLLQMTKIREHLRGREALALIAGDFNEWSDVRGYEPWEGHFNLCLPGRSYHARRPVAALDGIAHGTGLDITAMGVDTGPLARTASDHLPIWADLERVATEHRSCNPPPHAPSVNPI
ncbi:metal-dependent hydrolase [Salipiger aestuarii]|uniref:Endonuclease/exonuclease/phosphatase family metal-dependent hydrolase n=1 Tax=Salipiger aestuarii TaxID=568098 RepID=A0A327YQM1_9RHOB|nr:endonuclease/exonuclease/phosphatase family protein [Salipiger aestuarii]EIE48790.1 putative metal-dependent hydrolase [Citreicella sp. 357]KAA8610443.1 metal-dependent hydrolase [Salipiger aestuarii]KAB2543446.1 metal-dependent hydrolase [Salipiger aestuarii]RAK21995.1 endonuclease/exonuclease/phosphatase family metal-dependent hydrolase [Salipiger aestuarii]